MPLPSSISKSSVTDHHVNFIAAHAVPKAMAIGEIEEATAQDEILQMVITSFQAEQWPDNEPNTVDPFTHGLLWSFSHRRLNDICSDRQLFQVPRSEDNEIDNITIIINKLERISATHGLSTKARQMRLRRCMTLNHLQ